MLKIKCDCNLPECNTTATITQDNYLTIRERHTEHHIASIKLPGPLAAYIRIHLRYPDKEKED